MTVKRMHAEVARFQKEILDFPIPGKADLLPPGRKTWAIGALQEELDEYKEAKTWSDEADALIDLTYFALGRLIEMGLPPGVGFDEVHAANMKKERGELSKRPDSGGYDAIKPPGWTPPDLSQYIRLTRQDIDFLMYIKEAMPSIFGQWCRNQAKNNIRRVAIIGHGGHGKDTVAEMLEHGFGYKYHPTSFIAAAHIIRPVVYDEKERDAFLDYMATSDLLAADMYKELDDMKAECTDGFHAQSLFDNRSRHRTMWLNILAYYNKDDPASLAKRVLEESDIYVGCRRREEFDAIKKAGLFDLVIWVDRSKHVAPEPLNLMELTPDLAGAFINNNDDFDGLQKRLKRAMLQAMK